MIARLLKVLIVILVACNIFVFGLIAQGVKLGYAAPTGSMNPTIENWALVACAPIAEYFVGDVIVFEIDGELIAHRIVEREDGKYRTRGDCEGLMVDPWTIADERVGGGLYGSQAGCR